MRGANKEAAIRRPLESDSLLPREFEPITDEIVALFRDSYGDDYRGDEKLRKKLHESDRVIRLCDSERRMGAVAILGAGRILAPATSPQYDVFGKRSALMIQLLDASRQIGNAEWVSIGLGYGKMQAAAAGANMYPLQDPDRVNELLEKAGESDQYTVSLTTESGLIIEKLLPNATNTYQQQIWTYGE